MVKHSQQYSVLGSCVILDQLSILHVISSTHPVDLLINLSSVMVTLLSSSEHGELNPDWMPSTNTGNLPQTLVSLPGKLLGVPSAGDSLESMTLGDSNDVNHLILSKHSSDWNLLLEVVPGKVNLIGDRSTSKLDLHDAGLLLTTPEDLHLCVHDHTDGGAVLLHLQNK